MKTSVVCLTRSFGFEMAHALLNHDGKCRNLHGHSYQLFVTVKGPTLVMPGHPKDGMVMDFRDLKEIVQAHIIDRFDHCLMLNALTPPDVVTNLQGQFEKICIMPFQPTSENIVIYIAERLQALLPKNVTIARIKLAETSTSFVEWTPEDNHT